MATESGEWIVEDAYADLITGKAHIYFAFENDYWQGYFIVQQINDSLHIWAVYGKNTNLFKEGMDALTQLAHSSGLNKITFSTVRRGWDRVAPKLGFKPKTWVYEC